MKRKSTPEVHPDAFTDAELEFSRSRHVPDEIKAFLSRRHETIGVSAEFYRKVAADARAQRHALMEVRMLAAERIAGESKEAAEAKVARLESDKSEALAALEDMRKQVSRLTAIPAAATSSYGTGK